MSADANTKALIDTIDFGLEVQAFLQSNIGKYLIQRAEAEVEENVEALKAADAEKPRDIRALQHNIRVAESIQYWLAEAIQSGVNAQREFIESST